MKRRLFVCLAAAAAFSSGAAPAVEPATKSRVLTSHPVVHALSAQLAQGSGIEVVRAAPARLPPARQVAYFEGRGAAALAKVAADADAAIGLRSLWPQDPLYPLARRTNIRVVEIDAARPVDGALPGLALQPGADIGSYPWLHTVNLGRMADIVGGEMERLVPGAAPAVARNLAALKQRLVALSAKTESDLLSAPNVAVISLSPRLDHFVAGFNLEPVRVAENIDADELARVIRREQVAVVLHHEELAPELARAVTAAGATVVVVETAGEDPVSEIEGNARRLVQALRP